MIQGSWKLGRRMQTNDIKGVQKRLKHAHKTKTMQQCNRGLLVLHHFRRFIHKLSNFPNLYLRIFRAKFSRVYGSVIFRSVKLNEISPYYKVGPLCRKLASFFPRNLLYMAWIGYFAYIWPIW